MKKANRAIDNEQERMDTKHKKMRDETDREKKITLKDGREEDREKKQHMIEMKTVLWILILKRVIYFCQ